MNAQRQSLWRWRHQRLDGVKPKVGDVVWSALTPSRRWEVIEGHKDNTSWIFRVESNDGLSQQWKWTKAKTTVRAGKTSHRREDDMFDHESPVGDDLQITGRNDFGGYFFERKAFEKPHPKAIQIQGVI